jgi:hypothetical protein
MIAMGRVQWKTKKRRIWKKRAERKRLNPFLIAQMLPVPNTQEPRVRMSLVTIHGQGPERIGGSAE